MIKIKNTLYYPRELLFCELRLNLNKLYFSEFERTAQNVVI